VISTIRVKKNPVRYSTPMMLLLAACLLFAQHYRPSVIHGGMTNNDLVAQAGGNSSRQIAYVLIGAIGIVGMLYVRRQKKPLFSASYWLTIPLTLLVGWCMLSISWSDMPMVATKRIIVLGLLFLGSFGLALSWESIDIVKFIVFSSAIHVTISLVSDIVTGFFAPASPEYRFAGTLTPNEQGYLCVVFTISSVCLGKMMKSRGEPRWLYSSLAIYGFILLILTRSRGALIALGISMLFYFLLVVQTRKKVLGAFLLGTFSLALIMSGSGTKVLDTLTRGGDGTENFTGRAPLWDELMGYVDERPWTGFGYESFWNAQTMDDVYRHQHWPVESAHSQYVESLLTIGIIGMVLHSIALLSGLIQGIRRFLSTRNLMFFLAAVMCCIYLVGGSLEAILIVKPSPISFYFAILLCSMMVPSKAEDRVTTPVARLIPSTDVRKFTPQLVARNSRSN
jgi:exopolysaccharide production protein ExoQ